MLQPDHASSLPASTAIEVDGVELSLGTGAARVHILKGVSLKVPFGSSLALVGPSGSGKSTLLMVMAGLERIDAGRLVVAGRDLSRASEDEFARFRRQNVGIVFQSFHLIPNMTALENVAVPLELSGVRDAFDRARAELELVGLGGRLGHYPGMLSGGEQQRVAIARALVAQPAILFADEPTGNLDEANGRQIADLIFSVAAARGATLVLVTHDPALAARCERIVRVHSGRLDVAEEQVPARSAAE